MFKHSSQMVKISGRAVDWYPLAILVGVSPGHFARGGRILICSRKMISLFVQVDLKSANIKDPIELESKEHIPLAVLRCPGTFCTWDLIMVNGARPTLK